MAAEDKKSTTEEFKLTGKQLVEKVKEILNEGNARSITIKNEDGKTIMALPVTVGVIGAVVAPMLAAVGAVAAIVTKCSIVVERK